MKLLGILANLTKVRKLGQHGGGLGLGVLPRYAEGAVLPASVSGPISEA